MDILAGCVHARAPGVAAAHYVSGNSTPDTPLSKIPLLATAHEKCGRPPVM